MKNINILFAEDNQLLAMCIVTGLENEGYQIKYVENGLLALNELERRPDYYDILLTDLDMPIMSGTDLIRNIHSNQLPLKVVVITGDFSYERKSELKALGVAKVLKKPVTVDVIADILENLS